MRLFGRGVVGVLFGLFVLVVTAALIRGFGAEGTAVWSGVIFIVMMGCAYVFWTRVIDPWLSRDK